jgi:hypothetical protein
MVTAVAPEIAIRSRSPLARGRYIEATEQATRGRAGETAPRAVLERGVAWLELFYMSALTWEYIHEHRVGSVEQLRSQAQQLDQFVRCGFPDLDVGAQQIRDVLGDLDTQDELLHADWSSIDWPQVVRSFDAVVAEFPIEGFEDLGTRVHEPGLAHRARNAYDALRAFVRRHDPARAEIMRIVGEQYRRGHIRLNDAARLLGMSRSDAVFELEQDGFSRPPSAIALTEADRDAVYQRLRQRRLQCAGVPVVDPDLVERDVIASERIESVDARSWIRRR